jgi:hypothetical protein
MQEERKDLKNLSEIFYRFQIEIILERKIHSWYIRARISIQKIDQGGGDGI